MSNDQQAQQNTFFEEETRQTLDFLIATINEHLPRLQEIVTLSTPSSDEHLGIYPYTPEFEAKGLRAREEGEFSEKKQSLEVLSYLKDDLTQLYNVAGHLFQDITPEKLAEMSDRIPSCFRSLVMFPNAYWWSQDYLHEICNYLFLLLPTQPETPLRKSQRYLLEELRDTILEEFEKFIHFYPSHDHDDYDRGWIKWQQQKVNHALFAYYLAMKEEEVYTKDFERLHLIVNSFYTPEILTSQNIPLAAYEKAYQDYINLYQDLPMLGIENSSIIAILVAERMREIGERIQRVQAPGVLLWDAIRPIVTQPAPPGASPLLNEQSQALLETFLTTPKSMNDLAREGNGLRSVAGVRKNLNTSLQRVWKDIPPQDRQGYQNAEEALQAVIASPVKTEETRRKSGIQPGWKVDKPRRTGKTSQEGITGLRGKANKGKQYNVPRGEDGKKIFSPDHHTHLSDAASRRWQRQREMQQLDANGNTSN